jgi:hypothetical protein
MITFFFKTHGIFQILFTLLFHQKMFALYTTKVPGKNLPMVSAPIEIISSV